MLRLLARLSTRERVRMRRGERAVARQLRTRAELLLLERLARRRRSGRSERFDRLFLFAELGVPAIQLVVDVASEVAESGDRESRELLARLVSFRVKVGSDRQKAVCEIRR